MRWNIIYKLECLPSDTTHSMLKDLMSHSKFITIEHFKLLTVITTKRDA